MSETVTVEIKSRRDDAVLFAAHVDISVGEPLRRKVAVELAVKARADLAGAHLADANLAGAHLADANLAGAHLGGAYLAGAHLADANLAGANLARAHLADANLAGANLDGANLDGAYLAGANLGGANLDGAYLADANLAGAYLDGAETLTGARPILQVGPIGSASRWLVAYNTTAGVRLRTGCFFGSCDQFRARLADTHGDNIHAQEYLAALALIDVHAALWAPKECGAAEEAAEEAAA